jgi:hypothetical protein
LAAAQVLQKLSAPLSEIESVTFGLLNEDVKLVIPVRLCFCFQLSISSSFALNTYRCLQTALSALSLLSSCNSSRADEFRIACDAKFELSTVFKTPSELAPLREQVLLGSPSEPILEEIAQS